MFGINEGDRDYLRFLWLNYPTDKVSEIIHRRFTHFVFGLKPSPAVLWVWLHFTLSSIVTFILQLQAYLRNRYMSMILLLGQILLMKPIIFTWTVRTWWSMEDSIWGSGIAILLHWRKKDEDSEVADCASTAKTDKNSTPKGDNDEAKLLGVQWDSDTDNFKFDFRELQNFALNLSLYKRSILRVSAGVFDPLDFLNPFVVRLKMLFQLLCTSKQSWDEPLEEDLLINWKKIIEELFFWTKLQYKDAISNVKSQFRYSYMGFVMLPKMLMLLLFMLVLHMLMELLK